MVRLCISTAGGIGLILGPWEGGGEEVGGGTRVPHAMRHSQKKEKMAFQQDRVKGGSPSSASCPLWANHLNPLTEVYSVYILCISASIQFISKLLCRTNEYLSVSLPVTVHRFVSEPHGRSV